MENSIQNLEVKPVNPSSSIKILTIVLSIVAIINLVAIFAFYFLTGTAFYFIGVYWFYWPFFVFINKSNFVSHYIVYLIQIIYIIFAFFGLFILHKNNSIEGRRILIICIITCSVFIIVDIARNNFINLGLRKSSEKTYQESTSDYEKLKLQFEKPQELTELLIGDYFSFPDNPNISYTSISFSIGGKFYTNDFIAIFSLDNCKKDLEQDKNLRSFFDKKIRVLIELPEQFKNPFGAFGGPKAGELYFNKPFNVKDSAGKDLVEFNNLATRCEEHKYYQVWLPH